jgi:hypothetical protein
VCGCEHLARFGTGLAGGFGSGFALAALSIEVYLMEDDGVAAGGVPPRPVALRASSQVLQRTRRGIEISAVGERAVDAVLAPPTWSATSRASVSSPAAVACRNEPGGKATRARPITTDGGLRCAISSPWRVSRASL